MSESRVKLTGYELDLLDHLVNGRDTHRNSGEPIVGGAWIMACVEFLYEQGLLSRSVKDGALIYEANEAGRLALAETRHGE